MVQTKKKSRSGFMNMHFLISLEGKDMSNIEGKIEGVERGGGGTEIISQTIN